MFETNMTQNFGIIHAVNSHEFGTPSAEWLKFLDSLSSDVVKTCEEDV